MATTAIEYPVASSGEVMLVKSLLALIADIAEAAEDGRLEADEVANVVESTRKLVRVVLKKRKEESDG